MIDAVPNERERRASFIAFCDCGAMPIARSDAGRPAAAVADSGWVKMGRTDTITDAGRRKRFLDRVLDPLLSASAACADAVFAWELINEPEWVTNGWHPDRQTNRSILHKRNSTNERKSFVLWATIGAHSEFEYLNATAMTTPNTNIVRAVPALSEWSAIHPGTCTSRNSSEVIRLARQKPRRSANFCSMNPRYGVSSITPTRSDVPRTLFQVTRARLGCGMPNRAIEPIRFSTV